MTSEATAWEAKPRLPQVTVRSTIAGLAIGSLVLVSNFQFGLQTGWVSMMSLPSALLGFAIFKSFSDALSYPFTDVENVFVQSVAVSVGTGPLAYGFVGIIPAIEKFLTPEESGYNSLITFSLKDLVIWSIGLGFFGIFFAIPLRKQVIIKEALPFPSGSATATLISVLHDTKIYDHKSQLQEHLDHSGTAVASASGPSVSSGTSNSAGSDTGLEESSATAIDSASADGSAVAEAEAEHSEDTRYKSSDGVLLESQSVAELLKQNSYLRNVRILSVTIFVSSVYTLASYFVPVIRSLPIFGTWMSHKHLWNFQPSPAYIGQGIIMGLPTVSYMLFGAVLGWGIIAPLVQYLNWVSGPVDDWKTGAQGWIMWISLSVMVSDSVVSFVVVVFKSVKSYFDNLRQIRLNEESARLLNMHSATAEVVPNAKEFDVEDEFLVSPKITAVGLLVSTLVCVISIKHLFDVVDVITISVAVVLAFFLSVLAVRALGETDLNPVSGIGKLSQLIIALSSSHRSHPASILINLIAGGIAEAGAQQAGDLMQDLKTGHLLGASPKSQFIAQIIGTVWSVFLSSVVYKIYNYVYEIPSAMFRIPTSVIWIDCARLVNGKELPDYVMEVSVIMMVVFGVISLLKNTVPPTSKYHKMMIWLPSGVPVGIGLYNIPSFTLARFLGGVVAHAWMNRKKTSSKSDQKVDMIIFSSGLVLGEGIFSVVNMVMTNFGVPHF